jgi:glycosyltransferase involved in cell wall biosynthesis
MRNSLPGYVRVYHSGKMLRGGSLDRGCLSVAMVGSRGLPATDGGIEMAVEALSRELVKRGHRVTVYGRRPYCDPALDERDGVRQISLPVVDTKHLEAISHTVLASGHCAARGGYDVVHFHAVGPSLLSWLPRLRGQATVATVHACDWKREKWGGIARGVLRTGALVASTVPHETIVVSQALRQLLQEEHGRETRYIPNGVDLPPLTEARPIEGAGSRPFALFLGRIVPEKQVHLLVEAFSRAQGDFELLIAGGSSHSDDYLRSVERLADGDDRVTMLGPRHGAEKAWLLQNAAAFVQPSTLEGQPIALLEALSCERLTIVSDIPEHLEVVDPTGGGARGLVFRTGDSDDLTRKLELALNADTRSRGRPGTGERIRARYDWARIAGETESVYAEAVAARRSRRRTASYDGGV